MDSQTGVGGAIHFSPPPPLFPPHLPLGWRYSGSFLCPLHIYLAGHVDVIPIPSIELPPLNFPS